MVETILNNSSVAPSALASTNQASSGAESVLNSDFETFLRMLTVQAQNQDPLNPVDSSDYATQLATFSSVEQQVLTNDLLRTMTNALGSDSLQSMSGLVGMEALTRAPVFFDQSGPVAIRPELAPGADRGDLVVRDESGAILQRFEIPEGQDSMLWGGGDDTGELLPAGVYRFEVESFKDDALINTQLAPVFSRINEVRSEDGTVIVRLSDGSEIPESLITGLRPSQ
jgi:flagellar basal-body rod modification protein FlgD